MATGSTSSGPVTFDSCGESEASRMVELVAGRLRVTRRQAEVAYWLVALGKVCRIPSVLPIAEQTAKGHLRRLRRRFGVTRVGLAKAVCRALDGHDVDEVLTKRLQLTALRERLRLPTHLARVVGSIWEDRGAAKEIAEAQGTSVTTAQSYRDRVHRMLGTHSDVDVVRVVHLALSREPS